jgi:hypothetical protein
MKPRVFKALQERVFRQPQCKRIWKHSAEFALALSACVSIEDKVAISHAENAFER